jgi:putative endonuclease
VTARALRQVAERRGQRAERIALWLLRFKGYRLLARRYRVAVGEIDLIVRRRRVVVAVEVKARGEWAAAGEAIQPRQRRRIARALTQFVAARADLAGLDLRFDVMLVVPRRLPRHLTDAWRVEV